MNEQTIRFRFGIFVLASLILLAVLTILFGGFPSFFKRTSTYTIVFSNAQGLAPGTPIRRSGVRIGEVRSVVLDNFSGEVNVGISIDDQYILRKGDRPTLVQGLLGGDASIAFLPPEDAKLVDVNPVEPGTRLVGVTPADASAVLQKTGDLVQPLNETLVEIRKVFQRIDKMAPIIEGAMKDFAEIGNLMKQAAPELKKTNEEIRELAKTTREAVPEVRHASEEISFTARQWGKVGERVDVLLKTNEDKIVRSIERTDEALRRLNEVLSDENQKNLRETLKNVRNGTNQLESIANNTNELMKESRGSLKQLNGTLKRADDAFADIQRVMKPLGDKGPAFFDDLGSSADNLNRTLKDLRDLMQVVARSDGTVQRLLTDPSLYNNLNDSAEMITKILPRVDRTLRDMETFADKLARHPELLGLRGAIFPSLGLKDVSSMPTYRIYPAH